VIHDIFGWTLPNTRAICDMATEKGYVCVMPNLYPGGAWPLDEPLEWGKAEFMKK
jgi:dienelactone hydrolase